MKSAASETASSRLVPITSAVDRAMAAHWLADTNARPIVRVRYDPADILRLAKMGRGVVLASDSEGPTNAHELFLQGSSPDAPPLFAPFSRNIAARFSNYSLGLDPTSAFGALIEVLPAYFPSGAVHLAFVPDPSLATEIFSQVAFAKRTMADELGRSDHLVFEGDLTLSGNDPIFRVLPRTNK